MIFLIAAVSAHITFNPQVQTGSYSQANLRVPHGCEQQPTLAVTVKIPQGVSSVKPLQQQNWLVSITKRPLAVPIVSEGLNVTDEVDSIRWSQGNLPDNEYMDFGLSFKLPAAKDGDRFYFPAVQECGSGLSTEWTEIPVDGSKPAHPAPSVVVFANGTTLMKETNSTSKLQNSSAFRSTGSLVGVLISILVL